MISFYLAALDTDEERQKITEIYEKYKYLMMQKARRYTSDLGEAETIVQDAIVELIHRKEKIFSLPCGDLPRYIVSIVRSKGVDRFRRDSRVETVSLDGIEDTLSDVKANVENIAINRESFHMLRTALSEIDETSRIILEMKYHFGYSYNAIAESLNIKPKYVDTRLQRAKERLRRVLKDRGFDVTDMM